MFLEVTSLSPEGETFPTAICSDRISLIIDVGTHRRIYLKTTASDAVGFLDVSDSYRDLLASLRTGGNHV